MFPFQAIALRLLANSWRAIGFRYELLTESEWRLVSPYEFDAIVKMIRTEEIRGQLLVNTSVSSLDFED